MGRRYCAYCGGKAGEESADLSVGRGNERKTVCGDCQQEPAEYFEEA